MFQVNVERENFRTKALERWNDVGGSLRSSRGCNPIPRCTNTSSPASLLVGRRLSELGARPSSHRVSRRSVHGSQPDFPMLDRFVGSGFDCRVKNVALNTEKTGYGFSPFNLPWMWVMGFNEVTANQSRTVRVMGYEGYELEGSRHVFGSCQPGTVIVGTKCRLVDKPEQAEKIVISSQPSTSQYFQAIYDLFFVQLRVSLYAQSFTLFSLPHWSYLLSTSTDLLKILDYVALHHPRPRSSTMPGTSPTRIPLIRDGSYLEALGRRLNEAVSKTLAHPSDPTRQSELVRGRCPIPAGRGRAMGKLVVSELQAARDDKHLYRAVLRALQKPLSVLLNNLSALLLPLLSSPAFLQPVAPTLQMPSLNATQLHALAIADFAGELLSTFDDMALGTETDGRGDGLQLIRAGLVSLIGRVIAPLITGIKNALIPLLDALEIPVKSTPHKMKEATHPSITALQSSAPIYGRALARYASTYHADTLLASFLISIVWRGLVALSHRPMVSENSRCPLSRSALSPAGLFSLKRCSSQSASPVTSSPAVADAKALYKLFSQFPRPTRTRVAREAVEEAFAHSEMLVSLLEIADDPFFVANRTSEEIADEIHALTDELPTLIALPVLLRVRYFGGVLGSQVNSVATLLDVPEDVYRKDCLAGFGRAEECGPVIAQRILDEIYTRPLVDSSSCFAEWLETRFRQNDH